MALPSSVALVFQAALLFSIPWRAHSQSCATSCSAGTLTTRAGINACAACSAATQNSLAINLDPRGGDCNTALIFSNLVTVTGDVTFLLGSSASYGGCACCGQVLRCAQYGYSDVCIRTEYICDSCSAYCSYTTCLLSVQFPLLTTVTGNIAILVSAYGHHHVSVTAALSRSHITLCYIRLI